MINDDKSAAGSGSYVLDAMDGEERAEFESQLAESEELRGEVTELTDTAVLLGLAVEPLTPPDALKRSLMAQLDRTPQLPPVEATGPLVTVHTLATATGPAAARASRRWYGRTAVILTAAAAAVALIVGGLFGANIAVQNANSNQQASALAAISSAPDVQRAAASVSTGGTATLVWSDRLGSSALIGKGLRPLPSGKTYELWYIDSAGHAKGAGLFESDGKNVLRVLSGRMARGDTVGVTVEPAGGSKSPTTKPIVAIASA